MIKTQTDAEITDSTQLPNHAYAYLIYKKLNQLEVVVCDKPHKEPLLNVHYLSIPHNQACTSMQVQYVYLHHAQIHHHTHASREYWSIEGNNNNALVECIVPYRLIASPVQKNISGRMYQEISKLQDADQRQKDQQQFISDLLKSKFEEIQGLNMPLRKNGYKPEHRQLNEILEIRQ